MTMKSRQHVHNMLTENPAVDVLIIGGGVNGIGTFRDLALQGVRVLLVDKADYCSGASAASSHMLHGGLRYLEYGEFRLVREALHERNRLLKNAPHYAKPLPTTVPIFRWFSGLFNAPLRFLRLANRPSERGAIVIKLGLMLYDYFARLQRVMPKHQFRLRQAALAAHPKLNPTIICTATYYDAWMPSPERLCIDMLCDTYQDHALAMNYASVVSVQGQNILIQDEISGSQLSVQPKIVINAAGAWIDSVNQAIQQPTNFIGGTKGAHLILNHPELREAIGDSEIFFENADGRILLILPYHERVMVGTTDIPIDDPDQAICSPEEVDYILNSVKKAFPSITIDPTHIVYQFSGVRPLPASDSATPGAVSRDHHIQALASNEHHTFPIYSLIGGKWTSFRAFSEQVSNLVLDTLGQKRLHSTRDLAIGGGKDYPFSDAEQATWLQALHQETRLPLAHLKILFERYGTRAAEFAHAIAADNDLPLYSLPHYSQREILHLAEYEQVTHLDDLLMRRSTLAMLGELTLRPAIIREIAELIARPLAWDTHRIDSEIERTMTILTNRHGYRL